MGRIFLKCRFYVWRDESWLIWREQLACVSVLLYTKCGTQYVFFFKKNILREISLIIKNNNSLSVISILLSWLSGPVHLAVTDCLWPLGSALSSPSTLNAFWPRLLPVVWGFFCPPAAAVTPHYSQSAKWNIILNICIVISPVTLTRTRVNKAINHSGTSKLFCNSS